MSPELCNQIAAGEVVERPASVLKELVENSLDAGASQIDVRLDNGGQSLVRVQDDGEGIPADQLELAVTRHATSKISRLEDMDSIATYGFRGEALPSIASVSRFTITSRSKANGDDDGIARSLTVEYGRILSHEPTALRQGTVVEARDLFANMPARLRFLKQPASEFKRAQGWFTRLAIARWEIGFSLSAGDRPALRFGRGEELRDRLRHVWSAEITDQMLPLNSDMHGVRITGLVGPPHLQQPRPDRIFFYVNGRAINDKRLLAAVREAYKGRLISRDYPQLALFIDINPIEVDVNAHPAKTEVRFRNESAIFSAVYAALGQAFQKDAAVYPVSPPEVPPANIWGPAHSAAQMDKVGMAPRSTPQPWKAPEPEKAPILAEGAAPYSAEVRPAFPASASPADVAPTASWTYLGQIVGTYLVLNENDSLVLVDQHAAHERVLYHRYEKGFMQGSGQKLIIPLEIPLTAGSREMLEEMAPELQKLGFGFHVDGEKLVVDVIAPSLNRNGAKDFLKEVLAGCGRSLKDIWVSMACHAAIKAGQPLARDEALALLAAWRDTPESEFCPHGRPCVLRWNEGALERLFKRR